MNVSRQVCAFATADVESAWLPGATNPPHACSNRRLRREPRFPYSFAAIGFRWSARGSRNAKAGAHRGTR
jgi:hypothetical protein